MREHWQPWAAAQALPHRETRRQRLGEPLPQLGLFQPLRGAPAALSARAAARALSAQPRPYEGPYYFTPGGAFPLDDDRNPPRGPGGGHPASIALPDPARPSNEDAMLFPDPVAALDAAAALRADQDARRLHADDDVAKAA